ncbi:MAG: DPP IV N-terminal domain-containing protein [Deltaproteobacteria bacterium]|nr:DPP IV N-terminal domain-containing protein [Deltaproteobacteria bacterium]
MGASRTSRKFNFDAGVGLIYGSENLPTWMVEGVAQYDSMLYGADPYDTHREMILRMATLEDNLLTIDQMDVIQDKNSLQAEMVYNQGFSMNTFIGENWGLDMPAKMWHESGLGFYPTYNRMLKKELGVDRDTLYNQWKAYLTQKYNRQVSGILGSEAKGFKIKPFYDDPPDAEMTDEDMWYEGIFNLYPVYSPDGEYLAFTSNHGSMRGGNNVWVWKTHPDPEKINEGKVKKVGTVFFGTGPSWSPDSKEFVYTTAAADEYRGYYRSDLSVYNVEKEKIKQITFELRASQPAWSPVGDKIAFIINSDGQNKLAVMDYPGISGHYILVEFDDMTQMGAPTWSPDGSKIAFIMYRHRQQDIWMVDADGSNLRPVTYDHFDNRDPWWGPDGKDVFFASDRSGIYNIYKKNLETHELTQITDVIGGAFFPRGEGRRFGDDVLLLHVPRLQALRDRQGDVAEQESRGLSLRRHRRRDPAQHHDARARPRDSRPGFQRLRRLRQPVPDPQGSSGDVAVDSHRQL